MLSMQNGKHIYEILPSGDHELLFFVSTEYQLFQAHLVLYDIKSSAREINNTYLIILNNGRITNDLIVPYLWNKIVFLPAINNRISIQKLLAREYKKWMAKCLSVMNNIKELKYKDSIVYFYANDEKIENAILLLLLRPFFRISLEDGSANYIKEKLNATNLFKYYIKLIICKLFISTELYLRPTIYAARGQHNYIIRSNPDLVAEKNCFDMRVLFYNYAVKYVSSIMNINGINKNDFRPQVLYICYDIKEREIKCLSKLKERVLVKPHPEKILFIKNNDYCKRENILVINRLMPAEIIPLIYPSIKKVLLASRSSVEYTFRAFYPHIEVVPLYG